MNVDKKAHLHKLEEGRKIEFCSECGSMLVPKDGEENVLQCPDCGNEQKLSDEGDYKIKEEKRDAKSPEVAVVEEEKEKKIKEPKYDIDDDVKAEVFEDQY